MKFTWLHWLVVVLSAIIIYLILSRPSGFDSAVTITARDSVLKIIEHNRVLAMNARTLEFNMAKAIVKSSSDSARFYREITVKNQQLARKRVRIDTVFKDNEVVQDYLQTADSVFSMMRTRIDTLEADKQFQAALYNDLIYLGNKQITNLNVIISQKDLIIKDLEKQARKKRRGNKLWKAAAVVLGVTGVIGGSQL